MANKSKSPKKEGTAQPAMGVPMFVILVRGLRNVRQAQKDTLKQWGLSRIFHGALVKNSTQLKQQLHTVNSLVAFGQANDETVKKLQAKGSVPYRLHAPTGGFGTVKKRYPEGAYGNWGDKINELVQKMM
ncbi:uL30 family ribosomal protein [Candidatus Micrarchaeota archaeon]|nr:uL30 family ribosomal protein [Candidatus Micrarchaeota archaeon]